MQINTQNELKYRMITTCLKGLTERGLLTEAEFEIANGHNARKYKPIFSSVL